MTRQQAEEAFHGCEVLSIAVMEGDKQAINMARSLMETWGHLDEENVRHNLGVAAQATFRHYASGPVDDLQIGLTILRHLALEILDASEE